MMIGNSIIAQIFIPLKRKWTGPTDKSVKYHRIRWVKFALNWKPFCHVVVNILSENTTLNFNSVSKHFVCKVMIIFLSISLNKFWMLKRTFKKRRFFLSIHSTCLVIGNYEKVFLKILTLNLMPGPF